MYLLNVLFCGKVIFQYIPAFFHEKFTFLQGSSIPIRRHWFYEPNEYLIIELEDTLQVSSNYTLKATFSGELKNDMTGIYRSQYKKASGVIRLVILDT